MSFVLPQCGRHMSMSLFLDVVFLKYLKEMILDIHDHAHLDLVKLQSMQEMAGVDHIPMVCIK